MYIDAVIITIRVEIKNNSKSMVNRIVKAGAQIAKKCQGLGSFKVWLAIVIK